MWEGGHRARPGSRRASPAIPAASTISGTSFTIGGRVLAARAQELGLMLREGILKENIDGEALLWAYNR